MFAGLAVIVLALRRRWAVPLPDPAPPASVGEVVFTVLAMVPAAIGPNVLVVALTPGMPGMPTLTRWLLIPSLAWLLVVWGLAGLRKYERLQNRIWTGLWVGAATTAALDVFRLTSFRQGLLPGNLPRMFGVLILDTMALVPRAGTIRDTRGLIKMVADAHSQEVLGVSMVGPNAAEVIHEAAMAMRFHATLQDFIELLHVYPTVAEALKIAAISRFKDPAKLFCCAE